MKQILRLASVLAAAASLGTSSAWAQAIPAGATAAMVAKGDTIFHKQGLCYACHGQDAKGLVGPNLTDDIWLHSKGTYDDIVKQVMTGVPKEVSKSGIPMPPRGGSTISDDDVKAVAAYVYSLSHKT